MKLKTLRIAAISVMIIVIGGGILGWIMDLFGLDSQSGWDEPVLAMPIVSTRGHFRNTVFTPGHEKFDYTISGEVQGFSPGTRTPDDILIIVHGFNNYPQEAANACGRARRSLLENGFDAEIVGYSWDANTQLEPGAMIGFHEGRVNAIGNGPKLARFIVDYKARSPSTRIHVLGYSLGTRIVLEAVRTLAEDPALSDLAVRIDSVHLVGASVDNEEVQTNNKYGTAIEKSTGVLYNYYSISDKVLGYMYIMKEGDRALGETDIQNPNFAPSNYFGVNAHDELVSFDESGHVQESRRGDNHMGCLGILDSEGNVRDDGVMNLVAENIIGARDENSGEDDR